MEQILTEFCEPLSDKNPKRIEKLTAFLDLEASLTLIMTLNSVLTLKEADLTKNSCIKAYMIEFIKDARELGITDEDIKRHITSP